MSIESFGGFNQPPKIETVPAPAEKLKGVRKELWQRAQALLSRFGFNFEGKAGDKKAKEIIRQIKGVEQSKDGDKFLDLELEYEGKPANLRAVAQIDPNYVFDREKNYDTWDYTAQEEAERWLNREILVNEKLGKFFAGESVNADGMIAANRDPRSGAMYILKRTKEQTGGWESYGREEGRAAAGALLSMQKNLDATGMIKEIMKENNITTKLEMERKIFEDYFDHFDGYKENTEVILGDMEDEEMKERIAASLESYRAEIESRQLAADEYSFVHGSYNLETLVISADKRAYLRDWQLSGKTQNRELSIVYDLGNLLNDAIEKFKTADQAKEFIAGAEEEIRANYGVETAEAVINLAKLRSFAMILNDLEGEKKDFVQHELNSASAATQL